MTTQRLVYLDRVGGGARLYLLGLSTVDALKLFAPETPLAVKHLSGETGFGPSRSYVSQGDIPALATVLQAVQYLEREEELGLFDFKANLDDGATLTTHDDGEATFGLASEARAIALLGAILGPDAAVGRTVVLDHAGCYVLIEGDATFVFETFDQVLASGRLREG